MNTSVTDLSIDVPGNGDLFIDVSDEGLAGRGVQGMGYDPIPAPRISSITGGSWWNQDIVVHGD